MEEADQAPTTSKVVVFIVMWCIFFISLALMVADLVLAEVKTDLAFFYVITNAILIFRIFGVFWILVPLHAIAMIAVIFTFFYLNFDKLNNFYKLSIGVPVVVESILSFDLLLFRALRTQKRQAYHAGIHAHIGLLVVILYFWSICGVKRRDYVGGLLTMFYMLVFLTLCLTPHFYGLSQDVLHLKGKTGQTPQKAESAQRKRVVKPPKNTVLRMGTIAPGHADDRRVIKPVRKEDIP